MENLIRLEELRLKVISEYYESILDSLSCRSRNILLDNDINYISAKELLCTDVSSLLKLKSCGKKSACEISQMLKRYESYINTVSNEDFDTLLSRHIQMSFPFLTSSQISFTNNYYKSNSILPLFYILYNYVLTSDTRMSAIFLEYWGINCSPLTMKEIADKRHLTFERVRQLITQYKITDSKILDLNWEQYDFLNSLILVPKNHISNLLINEGLSFININILFFLCTLISDFKTIKVNRKLFFVSEKLLHCFDLKQSIQDIDSTVFQKCAKDVKLNISVFINSYITDTTSLSLNEIESSVIEVLRMYNISVNDNGNFLLKKNCLDRKIEIYSILETNRKPMSLSSIYDTYRLKFPLDTDVTLDNIRFSIFHHPDILPLGKRGIYGLKKWTNIYSGTIRDLLYSLLLKSESPLDLNTLLKEVKIHFPSTTKKSINTSMGKDERNRFVKYTHEMWGLREKKYSTDYVVDTLSRHTFEYRCEEYENFVFKYHHSPQSSGTEHEKSLYRWYFNILKDRLYTTKQQKQKFLALIEKCQEYFMSGLEYQFHMKCKEFELYLEENFEFPSLSNPDSSELRKWFDHHVQKYISYKDKRKDMFKNLLLVIENFGFGVL